METVKSILFSRIRGILRLYTGWTGWLLNINSNRYFESQILALIQRLDEDDTLTLADCFLELSQLEALATGDDCLPYYIQWVKHRMAGSLPDLVDIFYDTRMTFNYPAHLSKNNDRDFLDTMFWAADITMRRRVFAACRSFHKLRSLITSRLSGEDEPSRAVRMLWECYGLDGLTDMYVGDGMQHANALVDIWSELHSMEDKIAWLLQQSQLNNGYLRDLLSICVVYAPQRVPELLDFIDGLNDDLRTSILMPWQDKTESVPIPALRHAMSMQRMVPPRVVATVLQLPSKESDEALGSMILHIGRSSISKMGDVRETARELACLILSFADKTKMLQIVAQFEQKSWNKQRTWNNQFIRFVFSDLLRFSPDFLQEESGGFWFGTLFKFAMESEDNTLSKQLIDYFLKTPEVQAGFCAIRTPEGYTILHIAARHCAKELPALIESIKQKNPEFLESLSGAETQQDGYTPLMIAARSSATAVPCLLSAIMPLSRRQAILEHIGNDNKSALTLAEVSHPKTAKFIARALKGRMPCHTSDTTFFSHENKAASSQFVDNASSCTAGLNV